MGVIFPSTTRNLLYMQSLEVNQYQFQIVTSDIGGSVLDSEASRLYKMHRNNFVFSSRDLEKSSYFEINEEAVVLPLFHVKKCAI